MLFWTMGLFILGLLPVWQMRIAAVSSMSLVTKGAFSEPTLSVKDYIHSAPSKSGVKITRTINFKTENDKDGFSSGPAFLPLHHPVMLQPCHPFILQPSR